VCLSDRGPATAEPVLLIALGSVSDPLSKGWRHARETCAVGIEAEHQRPQRVKDEVRCVATDLDETHRTRRLLTYVRAFIEAANPDLIDELNRADQDDRDERKPAAMPVVTDTASKAVSNHAESAPIPSADEAETAPVDASFSMTRRS